MHGISRNSGRAATLAAGLLMAGQAVAQMPPPPTSRTPLDAGGGQPVQSFGAPPQTFGMPQQTFGAPQQTFGAPQPSFGAPQPSFDPSQQVYTQPGLQMPVPQVPADYVPPAPAVLGFGPGEDGGLTAEAPFDPSGGQQQPSFAPQPMGQTFSAPAPMGLTFGAPQPSGGQTFGMQMPSQPAAMPTFGAPMAPAPQQASLPPVEDFPLVARSWGGIVRAQPTMDSNKVASLAEGAEITLMARVEGPLFNDYAWFRINYGNNKNGFQWGGIICGINTPINGALGVCK